MNDSREEVSKIMVKIKFELFTKDGWQTLHVLIRRIQDVTPVAAIWGNDEMTKFKFLIKEVGNLSWSSFAIFNLEAPYHLIKLSRNMYKSIRLFSPEPDHEITLSSSFLSQTKRVSYSKTENHHDDISRINQGTVLIISWMKAPNLSILISQDNIYISSNGKR